MIFYTVNDDVCKYQTNMEYNVTLPNPKKKKKHKNHVVFVKRVTNNQIRNKL